MNITAFRFLFLMFQLNSTNIQTAYKFRNLKKKNPALERI